MSRYLSHSIIPNGEDYTIPAQFVVYFKNLPNFYAQIRDLYLGSTLTSALEYEFTETKIEVTLLLDTNFVVSLLDLNTPESTHTCEKLLEICKKIEYKFLILPETIEEIKSLITFKANNLDSVAISKFVNKEDIFNACERKKLSKVDLDRICDNLEKTLENYDVLIVANTVSLKNKAKFSDEYKILKKYRNTDKAALHDAMAVIFVKEKRNKNIREFEKVNCWFVNNSITHDFESERIDTLISSSNNQYQPEIIKADDLLNILWLSNPAINNSLANSELVDMGLTTLVAYTLNESLPKALIIKELDDNIQKYKSPDITDRDVYLLSTRIVNHQIKNIESLNELANKNASEFNRKIKEEARRQEQLEKERAEKLEKLYKKLEDAIGSISAEEGKIKQRLEKKKQKEINRIKTDTEEQLQEKNDEIKTKDEIIAQLQKEKIDKENNEREIKRNDYVNNELRKWRRKSWICLGCVGFLFLFALVWLIIVCNGNLSETNKLIEGLLKSKLVAGILSTVFFVVEGIIVKSLYDKYQNYSNIKAFKESINIPEKMKSLTI
jgi:hypothetical protein